jgi:hypothetical protein
LGPVFVHGGWRGELSVSPEAGEVEFVRGGSQTAPKCTDRPVRGEQSNPRRGRSEILSSGPEAERIQNTLTDPHKKKETGRAPHRRPLDTRPGGLAARFSRPALPRKDVTVSEGKNGENGVSRDFVSRICHTFCSFRGKMWISESVSLFIKWKGVPLRRHSHGFPSESPSFGFDPAAMGV